jgi:hypothetical protein
MVNFSSNVLAVLIVASIIFTFGTHGYEYQHTCTSTELLDEYPHKQGMCGQRLMNHYKNLCQEFATYLAKFGVVRSVRNRQHSAQQHAAVTEPIRTKRHSDWIRDSQGIHCECCVHKCSDVAIVHLCGIYIDEDIPESK